MDDLAQAIVTLGESLESWERSLTREQAHEAEAEGLFPRHWPRSPVPKNT